MGLSVYRNQLEHHFSDELTDTKEVQPERKPLKMAPLSTTSTKIYDLAAETFAAAPIPQHSDKKVESAEEIKTRNMIDVHFDIILSAYERELAKGENADPTKLYNLALRLLGFLMRNSSRDDQEQIQELTRKINKQVQDVKETYHNGFAIVLGVISAVTCFAGGFAGLSPLFGQRLFLAQATTEALSKASSSINAASQSCSMLEKISDNGRMGERTGRSHILEESKERRSGRQGAKSDKKHQEQTALSTIHDANKSENQSRIAVIS